MIGIIDYGSGNVNAIKRIYKNLSIETKIINKPIHFNGIKSIILPGVGNFDTVMKKLNKSGLRDKLDQFVLEKKIPILGICVGFQIMAMSSEEGLEPGLGWLDADILKFNFKGFDEDFLFTPHMGWNNVYLAKNNPIFENVDYDQGFYFVHSYYFQPNRQMDKIGITNYGIDFVSTLMKDNIFGTQFHPEKSHQNGINLLKSFSKINA